MQETGTKQCRECGEALDPNKKSSSEFCGTPCRISWRNRRSSRGAELYDVFMAIRFERGAAKLYGLWALACRMASVWKQEDDEAGRQSYFDVQEIRYRTSRYRAEVLVKR